MVSALFKEAVRNRDLLKTKIMIKNSFLVDPTCRQADEMIQYAKTYLPDIFVPFDGAYLEQDRNKWNVQMMNMELVELVSNFSEVRIQYVKHIVIYVLGGKFSDQENTFARQPKRSSIAIMSKRAFSKVTGKIKKLAFPSDLTILKKEGCRIQHVLERVKKNDGWTRTDVDTIECAAKAILKAAKSLDDKENDMGIITAGKKTLSKIQRTIKELSIHSDLTILEKEGRRIQNVLERVKEHGEWTKADVDAMECAAKAILKAAQGFKNKK